MTVLLITFLVVALFYVAVRRFNDSTEKPQPIPLKIEALRPASAQKKRQR